MGRNMNPSPPTPAPHAAVAEPVGTTLARMEGVLNGVDYKVGDLMKRMGKVEERVDRQESVTQQLGSDASAAAKALVEADKGREVTARAIKDADADRVAAAKDKVDQSNAAWTPAQRLGGFLVGLAVIASMGINVILLMRGMTG